jgi:ABC-type molybdate transport system substrate-binding protein
MKAVPMVTRSLPRSVVLALLGVAAVWAAMHLSTWIRALSAVPIAFQVALDTDVLYPIAVVKGGGASDVGKAFVKFILTDKAQAILARFKFSRP